GRGGVVGVLAIELRTRVRAHPAERAARAGSGVIVSALGMTAGALGGIDIARIDLAPANRGDHPEQSDGCGSFPRWWRHSFGHVIRESRGVRTFVLRAS